MGPAARLTHHEGTRVKLDQTLTFQKAVDVPRIGTPLGVEDKDTKRGRFLQELLYMVQELEGDASMVREITGFLKQFNAEEDAR